MQRIITSAKRTRLQPLWSLFGLLILILCLASEAIPEVCPDDPADTTNPAKADFLVSAGCSGLQVLTATARLIARDLDALLLVTSLNQGVHSDLFLGAH